MALIVGTDIGGTFTDIVGYDAGKKSLFFGKALTDYYDLVEGVFACLAQVRIDPADIDVLKHGTTQIINDLLERKGARTALVTTEGFRDILEIGRASRPLPFDLGFRRNPPLVERIHRFEVRERMNASGAVLKPLDLGGLGEVCRQIEEAAIEAVAVSFLNSYVNPAHELAAADFIRERLPNVYVTTGVEHSREWFEYERGSTAAANAYVGPRASRYVRRLEERLKQSGSKGQLLVMGSHGGVLSVRRACEQPIALVESGPIGGCIGATVYARALGVSRMIAFDMGGTTAKCAVIENGAFEIQPTYFVGGYEYGLPLRTPVLDIVEVGTGGGSIAHLDAQGKMHVGPRSAGSEPGPVGFLRGGTEPTVTDANLILGRIGSGAFLSGSLQLDAALATSAMMDKVGRPLGFADEEFARVAEGILALANVQMGSAIREVTVERGKDVRDFTLFTFGGGGPMHGVDLARELGIANMVVPPEPGNFSALGMLFAAPRIDELRTLHFNIDEAANRLPVILADMEANAVAALKRDFNVDAVDFERQSDMRYVGQRHTIRIGIDRNSSPESLRSAFLEAYSKRYGRSDEHAAIEMIGLRVCAIAAAVHLDLEGLHRAPKASLGAAPPTRMREVYFATAGKWIGTPVLSRYDLHLGFSCDGPVIVEEFGSTTVIGPYDRLTVGRFGELQIEVASLTEVRA
jgi:N-methylhydantoinase A